jgi:hypothetical protein
VCRRGAENKKHVKKGFEHNTFFEETPSVCMFAAFKTDCLQEGNLMLCGAVDIDRYFGEACYIT